MNISTVSPVSSVYFLLRVLRKLLLVQFILKSAELWQIFFQVRFFSRLARRPLGREGNLRGEFRSLSLPWTCLPERESGAQGTRAKVQDNVDRTECHHPATITCPCSGSAPRQGACSQDCIGSVCLASHSLIYFLLILSKNSEEVGRILQFIGCFGKRDGWAGWMVLELVLSQ